MSSSKISRFLLNQIPHHPSDIVRLAAENFAISPQAIHRHLRQLVKAGLVKKVGRTKAIRYELSKPANSNKTKPLLLLKLNDPTLIDEHRVWESRIAPILPRVPENVRAIAEFGVTEILNNARDHADATLAWLSVGMNENEGLQFTISDNGVGIFEKIRNQYKLHTPREAVLELSKGKVTTDPARHSGQGIFFTSRAFDQMFINSGGLAYIRSNEEDWLLDKTEWNKGTSVTMMIDPKSKTDLKALFEKYAGEENDYSFSKTQVAVALAADESFVSRSQAKRIVLGLEKFKTVVLNFKNVESIGQGFVDEIFRVFANKYPETKIIYINANENVDFMIKRSLVD